MAAQPREPARRRTAYIPYVGELVRDMDTGKTGAYMGTERKRVYLRRPEGGVEWTVKPLQIEPVNPQSTTNAA